MISSSGRRWLRLKVGWRADIWLSRLSVIDICICSNRNRRRNRRWQNSSTASSKGGVQSIDGTVLSIGVFCRVFALLAFAFCYMLLLLQLLLMLLNLLVMVMMLSRGVVVGPQEVVDGGSAVCWLFGANGGVDCVDAVQRVVPRHQLVDGRQRGGRGKGAFSRVVVEADDGRLGNGPLNASPLKTRRQVVLFAT